MTVHEGVRNGERWRLAPSLVAMEAEADRLAPKRSTASDGSIGDAAHAARKSDHNPQEAGAVDWVDALDITHDPARGMDIHARLRDVARRVQRGEERRVDYLISNGQIFSLKGGAWAWRPYGGSNPHRAHGHVSIKDTGRTDTSPWFTTTPPPPPAQEDIMATKAELEAIVRKVVAEEHGKTRTWIREELKRVVTALVAEIRGRG